MSTRVPDSPTDPNPLVSPVKGSARWRPGRRLPLLLLTTGLVLAAAGAKWQLLRDYGSEVPYMDQWVAETVFTLEPWLDGTFDAWKAFWWAHNEHRIGLTRYWSLALTLANGQWDPLFISTVNAVLHALFAGGIVFLFRRQLCGPAWILVPGSLAAVLLASLSWENTLLSFQVQFYFLLGTGAVHIAGVATGSAGSWRWWLGMLAGAVGLGSMASSFLAPSAALGARVIGAARNWCWTRHDSATVAGCGILIAIGINLFNPVGHHEALKAQSPGQFLASLSHILAYPAHRFPAALFLLQAPMVWWLIEKFRNRKPGWGDGDSRLLGFAGWAALLAIAAAYGRGNVVFGISSRYVDLFVLLLVVNAVALGRLWTLKPGELRLTIAGLSAVWALVGAWGVQSERLLQDRRHLEPGLDHAVLHRAHLRTFVESEDEAAFRRVPARELPLPYHDILVDRLSHPGLRDFLPAAIRPALPLRTASGDGFSTELPAGIRTAVGGRPALHADGSKSATWMSEPVPRKDLSRAIRISVIGPPAPESSRVSLVFDGDPASAITIRPDSSRRWRDIDVALPRDVQTVRLTAEAGPDGAWLAFTLPVEIASGSWLAGRARASSPFLLWTGAALLAAGWVVGLLQPMAEKRHLTVATRPDHSRNSTPERSKP